MKKKGILWNEGYVPYLNYKVLLSNYKKDKCIYAKGSEKVVWLKSILETDNVYNLEDSNCPSLSVLYENYILSSDIFKCIYHNKICALKNVSCLYKWCLENSIIA